MEVMNILETKVYKLFGEEKSPGDIKLVGMKGSPVITSFHPGRKEKCRTARASSEYCIASLNCDTTEL